MQYATIHFAVALLFIIFASVSLAAHKREIENPDEALLTKKRPFCNAFTGCGRKRSDFSPGTNDLETDLLLEKLSQQILALVHLLEALHLRIEATKQQKLPNESRIPNFLTERKRRSTETFDLRTPASNN